MVKWRGGRVGREHAAENVAVVANQPIRPIALEMTKLFGDLIYCKNILFLFYCFFVGVGAFDLNKLTPEDGFTVDNMHRISSRGSIPVSLEEPLSSEIGFIPLMLQI